MQKIKILIVEDDQSTQRLYDKGLGGIIFEKNFVDNGAEALSAYRQWQPDIILLDIMLPDVSGFTVLKEIR